MKKLLLLLVLLVAMPAWAADESGLSAEDIATGYYRPLAEQGEPYAQLTMGEIYYRGEDLPKDLVKAYAWLSVAAAQQVAEASELRDKVRAEMSEAQLAEGDALAREFVENFIPKDD